MSLKHQITEDMKTAMRAKDSARLGTIRLLQAAMKQKEVDERVELDDIMVIAIVDKLIKQRKDSVAAYQSAGRQDLADIESAEMAVLPAAPVTWAKSWLRSRPNWLAKRTWAKSVQRSRRH